MAAKELLVDGLQLRHDTAANWRTKNPILAAGEAGMETDTFKFKMGDGSTTWNNVPYANSVDLSAYLTSADAATTYATKEELDNAVTGGQVDLSGYLTKTEASSTYLGKSAAAASANKLNTNAGSATQPVYFDNGVPVKTTYTLGASVPSGAKFTDTTYSAATTSAAGLMSAADKTKLDGIEDGANAYSLPPATKNTLGGVMVGSGLTSNANGAIWLTKANVTSVLGYTPQTPETTIEGYGITDVYTKTEVDNAIGAKANTADLADVATSGAYADLTGTPTSLKNPTSLTLQNSAGTSLGSYDGSTAKTIKFTSSTVGLGNVTNESKATMFASAALTGTPTAPTAAATTNSTQIATTAFVNTVVNNKIAAADAMIYKGTIGTGGTVTALPNTHSTGWTYKVITAGTYAGVACNIGDMIICLTDGTAENNAHWTVIEGNIDGAVTGPASAVNARIAVFDGTTGKVIKDSGYTIATSVPSGAKFTDTTYSAATTSAAGLLSATDKSKLDGIAAGANAYTHPSYTARTGKPTANQTPAFGGTATVSQITSDALGHVTGATDRTITIPSTLSNGTGTAGLIKTTSTVTSNSGYTPCPVISGVPYYKDTDTTYTLGSFGISATATELNHCDGVTSNIQTQLDNKSDVGHAHTDYVDLTSEQSITGTKAFGTIDVSKINCASMLDLYASGQAQLSAKKIRWMLGGSQVAYISATQYSGNSASATKATQDGEENNIADTYAKIVNTYTKTEVDDLIANNSGDYTLPVATSNALGGVKVGDNISISDGTISVANGSTSAKGVVQLSSSVSSSSTSLAATASAVKSAYDLAKGKQSPATSLSGYGIADAYTKDEVDNLIANSGGSGGSSGGGGTLLTSYMDITDYMVNNIPFATSSLEMYIFDLVDISSELSISDIKFIEVCLYSMVGWDTYAWFDCFLTDTKPTTESDYDSINKILRCSSGQNQQLMSGVSVLLPPHVSGRYLVIVNYYGSGGSSGNTLGEFYVRLHM